MRSQVCKHGQLSVDLIFPASCRRRFVIPFLRFTSLLFSALFSYLPLFFKPLLSLRCSSSLLSILLPSVSYSALLSPHTLDPSLIPSVSAIPWSQGGRVLLRSTCCLKSLVRSLCETHVRCQWNQVQISQGEFLVYSLLALLLSHTSFSVSPILFHHSHDLIFAEVEMYAFRNFHC